MELGVLKLMYKDTLDLWRTYPVKVCSQHRECWVADKGLSWSSGCRAKKKALEELVAAGLQMRRKEAEMTSSAPDMEHGQNFWRRNHCTRKNPSVFEVTWDLSLWLFRWFCVHSSCYLFIWSKSEYILCIWKQAPSFVPSPRSFQSFCFYLLS